MLCFRFMLACVLLVRLSEKNSASVYFYRHIFKQRRWVVILYVYVIYRTKPVVVVFFHCRSVASKRPSIPRSVRRGGYATLNPEGKRRASATAAAVSVCLREKSNGLSLAGFARR